MSSDAWNYDMDAAPRGETRKVMRTIGKNTVEQEVHDAPSIIAADHSGTVVTVSRWIPKAGRWNMFSKDHPPLCWQPFPTHPQVPA